MIDLRAAAQRLLTAIDCALPHAPPLGEFDWVSDAADDLRAALKEPAEPEPNYWQEEARRYAGNADYWRDRAKRAEPVEPVAWMVYTQDGKSVCVTDNPADFTEQHRALPLYTAPPQRKPLTVERLRDALVASRIVPPAAVEEPDEYDDGVTLHRIEALHRRLT